MPGGLRTTTDGNIIVLERRKRGRQCLLMVAQSPTLDRRSPSMLAAVGGFEPADLRPTVQQVSAECDEHANSRSDKLTSQCGSGSSTLQGPEEQPNLERRGSRAHPAGSDKAIRTIVMLQDKHDSFLIYIRMRILSSP